MEKVGRKLQSASLYGESRPVNSTENHSGAANRKVYVDLVGLDGFVVRYSSQGQIYALLSAFALSGGIGVVPRVSLIPSLVWGGYFFIERELIFFNR